ncbi:NPL4-domain-containing protein [Neoconidiobolus thromboides FSU 785]|nr:NPL4-domain-containing protein [Neoconidiobolus thromboides FSU 785]
MTKKQIIEDEIDKLLDKEDGLIKRGKDSKFCKHASNGMCDYCMPLEPYDANYLEEKGIKHLSFHSYLRQIYPKHKRGTSNFDPYSAPLEEEDFQVKAKCSGGHAPWPQGICTKCQPSAITLQRQTFRFVDHVEFASAAVVDNFIRFWRTTGTQRIGYLLGEYKPYLEVPLGIKAVVEAIYEPEQENSIDELNISLNDENDEKLKQAAGLFGLNILGIIYTDLVDRGDGSGKVLCKRHLNSYFLSSQEAIFSASMQLKYPNVSRYSKSGQFGSKFLTCVVTGNLEGDIDIDAYQISNSGMAMVQADIIQASVQPSKVLVCEASQTRYVPEIFYKFKNEYNVTVKQNASPSFPVEYLLVNVSHGFPSSPEPMFKNMESFAIENRVFEKGDINILKKRMEDYSLPQALSDFHFLLFLKYKEVLSKDELDLTINLATKYDDDDFDADSAYQMLTQSNGWLTVLALLEHNEESIEESGQSSSSTWACRHCTFINSSDQTDCEMCSLPKD